MQSLSKSSNSCHHQTPLRTIKKLLNGAKPTPVFSFLQVTIILGGKQILRHFSGSMGFQDVGNNPELDHTPRHFTALCRRSYFYFDFNDTDKQTTDLMIRSLVSQLSQQCVKIPASLEGLFSSCQNRQREPPLDGLLGVMRSML